MIRFSLVFLFLSCSSLIAAKPDFRLIVTGSLLGIHGGDEAFYESALFRAGDIEDTELVSLVIQDAHRRAWSNGSAIFYAAVGPLSTASGRVTGMWASQLYGVSIDIDGKPETMPDSALRRELGALHDIEWESRVIDGQTIVAIKLSDKIVWPKSLSQLREIPSALGLYPKSGKQVIFFPRSKASTPRAFGIVDELLKKNPAVTRYIDLGDALTNPSNESPAMATQMSQLLTARNPVALGASRFDLHALLDNPSLAKELPYVMALRGNILSPSYRTVQMADNQVHFVAIGDGDSSALGFLPKDVMAMTVTESLRLGEKSADLTDVVVGIAESGRAAAAAISSPVFDFVLSLATEVQGALPAVDDMNLAPNLREGLPSSAALVRVSGSDVTELSVWVDKAGRVTRLLIERHPIIDGGIEASDARQALAAIEKQDGPSVGLPSQSWSQSALTDVLGSILLRSSPRAELALIDEVEAATPILSAIPEGLAEALLQRPGRAITISLRGKYIKRILKAMKARQLAVPMTLVGGSLKGPTIGRREVIDSEKYTVVVTERVLLEIDRFMAREALFASSTLPSNAPLTAMLEGNKEPIKILSEIRRRESKDDAKLGNTRDLLVVSPPIAEVVHDALKRGITEKDVKRDIREAAGRAKPTIIFEVSDLDIGGKFNYANAALEEMRSNLKKGIIGAPTEPRFLDSSYLNLLVYGKVALKYIGPTVDSELSSSLKFFQNHDDAKTVTTARPGKDSFKIEAELRIPLERVLENPARWVWLVSPIARMTWETQIWPNFLMADQSLNPYPKRVNDTRLMLGISGKPMIGDEVFHVGGVFGYDLSRDTPLQSIAFGAEIGAQGKWNLGPLTIKLESTLRDMFPIVNNPDAGRFGFQWLADGKIELPIYGGFSVSALLNLTTGSHMTEPGKFLTAVMGGLALSYGDRFKWLM